MMKCVIAVSIQIINIVFAFGDFVIDMRSGSERKADHIKKNFRPKTIRIPLLFLFIYYFGGNLVQGYNKMHFPFAAWQMNSMNFP